MINILCFFLYNSLELASMQMYLSGPNAAYEWAYRYHQHYMRCKPSTVHHTLTKMNKSGILSHLITQNVDRLHQVLINLYIYIYSRKKSRTTNQLSSLSL